MIYFEPDEEQQQQSPRPKASDEPDPLIFFEELEDFDDGEPHADEIIEPPQPAIQNQPEHHQQAPEAEVVPVQTNISQASELQSEEEDEPPPPPNTRKLSINLVDELLKHSDMRPLLYTPIPPPTKFQFKILRKKKLLEATYGCLIMCSETDRLIMVAKKQSLLSKSLFEITAERVTEVSRSSSTAGSINRNDGSYDFTDDGSFEVAGKPVTRRMGAVRIDKSLFSKRIELLTPPIAHNQVTLVEANSLSNFFELHKMPSFSSRFTQYSGVNNSDPTTRSIQTKLCFKESPNNLVMLKIGEQGDVKIILGKSGDHEFKMGVGDGLSPFQAFCTAVCWLES